MHIELLARGYLKWFISSFVSLMIIFFAKVKKKNSRKTWGHFSQSDFIFRADEPSLTKIALIRVDGVIVLWIASFVVNVTKEKPQSITINPKCNRILLNNKLSPGYVRGESRYGRDQRVLAVKKILLLLLKIYLMDRWTGRSLWRHWQESTISGACASCTLAQRFKIWKKLFNFNSMELQHMWQVQELNYPDLGSVSSGFLEKQ